MRCWILKFEWNERKNKYNSLKYGVTFEEAMSVFDDKNAIMIYDESNSVVEERFILI